MVGLEYTSAFIFPSTILSLSSKNASSFLSATCTVNLILPVPSKLFKQSATKLRAAETCVQTTKTSRNLFYVVELQLEVTAWLSKVARATSA